MMSLGALAQDIHRTAVGKGFWPGVSDPEAVALGQRNVGEALMLIVSEVAEAMEFYRDEGADPVLLAKWWLDGNDKPDGFPVELLDVIIRCLDLLAAIGVDVDELMEVKTGFNETRPYMHGRRV